MLEGVSWWHEVDAILEEKSLLKHPFYQAWTRGSLTREDLALYARQYYKQESRFPRFLSAVHSNCPDMKARQAILENMGHEESGPDNHPELWLRFAETVGASRDSVKGAEALPQTDSCVNAFDGLSRDPKWVKGLAALYAYEAQQPAVAKTKISGMKEFYGLDSKEALGFFEAHQEMDVWHATDEKKILMEAAEKDPAVKQEVKDAVAKACDALNTLLDGVAEKRGIFCEAQ